MLLTACCPSVNIMNGFLYGMPLQDLHEGPEVATILTHAFGRHSEATLTSPRMTHHGDTGMGMATLALWPWHGRATGGRGD